MEKLITDAKVGVFILQLNQNPTRLLELYSLVQLFEQRGIVVEILPTIDELSLSDKDCADLYKSSLYKPYYPFKLSKIEVARFLMHRMAWQKIIDNQLSAGLIIEDSITLEEAFFDILQFLCKFLNRAAYVNFSLSAYEDGVLLRRYKIYNLIAPFRFSTNIYCQLVGEMAAAKLLSKTQKIDRPLEQFLSLPWQTQLLTFTVVPAVIKRNTVIDMVDTSPKKASAKRYFNLALRKIKFAIYRFHLERYNKQMHRLYKQ